MTSEWGNLWGGGGGVGGGGAEKKMRKEKEKKFRCRCPKNEKRGRTEKKKKGEIDWQSCVHFFFLVAHQAYQQKVDDSSIRFLKSG